MWIAVYEDKDHKPEIHQDKRTFMDWVEDQYDWIVIEILNSESVLVIEGVDRFDDKIGGATLWACDAEDMEVASTCIKS